MKSLIEQLEELIPADQRATLRAKLEGDAALKARLKDMDTVYATYMGEDIEAPKPPVVVAPEVKPVVVPEVKPVVAAAAPVDLSAITAQLTALNTRLAEQEKNFVSVDKLPTYRGEIVALAIRSAHEVAQIENANRSEFNEALDLSKLEAFMNEQQAAGNKFSSITKAYDSFVQEKRIENRVKAEVAEQVKLKVSQQTVPGQTHEIALSPAQELLKKQSKSETASDGTIDYAARLAKIRADREGRGADVA